QHSEQAKSPQRTQLGKQLAALRAMPNLKSPGHDFVNELDDALTRGAPPAETPTGPPLLRLTDHGLKLSPTTPDIGQGPRTHAPAAPRLTTARLAPDSAGLNVRGPRCGNGLVRGAARAAVFILARPATTR
ncbi:AvrE-family type 3 secretion system effector, partial [Pseudomonas syringae]